MPRIVTSVSRPLIAAVATTILVGAFASNAGAESLNCEDVPYSERIIVVCTSTGADDPIPSETANEPADPSTQADDPDATGGASGAESDEPAGNANDDDDTEGDETNSLDRGDRGGRSNGTDTGLDDGGADAGGDVSGADDPDSDVADPPSSSDESEDRDDPPPSSDDSGDNASSDGDAGTAVTDDDGDESAGWRSLIRATDPEPDNLPIIAGLAALTVAGAGSFLAARRKNRNELTTSDGGRRTPR